MALTVLVNDGLMPAECNATCGQIRRRQMLLAPTSSSFCHTACTVTKIDKNKTLGWPNPAGVDARCLGQIQPLCKVEHALN